MVRTLQTKSVSATLQAARVALGASLTFLVLFASVHLLKPEFDPSWRFISEYSIGRFGWVMMLAFLAMATSCVALFLALRPHLRTIMGNIGLGFVLLGALGLTLAAIFTTDPITISKDQMTFSGNMHGLGAMLGNTLTFGATIITMLVLRNRAWGSARWAILGAALLIWGSLGWFLSAFPADAQFGPNVPIGWPNRLLMVTYGAWLMAAAWGALVLSKKL